MFRSFVIPRHKRYQKLNTQPLHMNIPHVVQMIDFQRHREFFHSNSNLKRKKFSLIGIVVKAFEHVEMTTTRLFQFGSAGSHSFLQHPCKQREKSKCREIRQNICCNGESQESLVPIQCRSLSGHRQCSIQKRCGQQLFQRGRHYDPVVLSQL